MDDFSRNIFIPRRFRLVEILLCIWGRCEIRFLNYAVNKGNVFKTYEGKLIQEGFGASKPGAPIGSNQFEFSIENEAVFKQLEMNSGKYFDLHYKEYHGTLPWRGNTVYVVDKVLNMK